jgi:predicted component of type VI protein secretion system
MKVQLIVVKGKPEGKSIPLTGPSFKIGRSDKCHLRPNSEMVSREHTEIMLTEDRVSIRDLGSRNGTIVNGKLIAKERALKNGDIVQVGPLTFSVDIQGAPAPVAAPSGGKKAKKPALEGISSDDIDAWLVADEADTPPERPSGVYTGDTQTFEAYKEADQAQATKPEAPAPKAAPKAAKPGAPGPKAAPKPAKPEPETPPAKEPEFELDFDPFAEGTDDEEAEAAPREAEDEAGLNIEVEDVIGAEEVGATAAAETPEELIDESNPIHAKKPAPEEAPKAKPKLDVKDSSSAANDLLKKMMDRRRPSK